MNSKQDQSHIKWISDFIWNIADDRLRDVYVRGKYRDVILPFTVLRRLDAVLEATKDAVLERKKFLDTHKVAEQDGALRMAAGQAFYNVSEFTLAKLKASAAGQRLRDDFIAYLDGFSPNVQEILTKFNFRNQIQKLVDSHVLGYLIDDFLDPEVNLAPLPVKDADGRIKLPALDNHGMGTVFEELIRRFNEENNEEAGEHFTPRDVVQLMAKLLFLPVAERIESSTYSLYDGSCGTGGMLTVAEEALHELAEEHGKEVSIHLFGQEISDETYAICKADMLLKGDGAEAENMGIHQFLNLVAEVELGEDLLHVGREAVQICNEVIAQALACCAGLELGQRELRDVVERLPRCHTQRAVLLGHFVGVQELLALEHRVFRRFEHGIEPPQYGEGQDHIAVLAAHVDVAQAVVSDVPDEVGNPLDLALVLLLFLLH